MKTRILKAESSRSSAFIWDLRSSDQMVPVLCLLDFDLLKAAAMPFCTWPIALCSVAFARLGPC